MNLNEIKQRIKVLGTEHHISLFDGGKCLATYRIKKFGGFINDFGGVKLENGLFNGKYIVESPSNDAEHLMRVDEYVKKKPAVKLINAGIVIRRIFSLGDVMFPSKGKVANFIDAQTFMSVWTNLTIWVDT